MSIVEEALQHAREEYPRESCGLVVVFKGREKYVRCENIAKDKDVEFVISPEDYANAEDLGEVIKVVHSHPSINPTPSMADLVSIEKTGLPWIIVNPLTGVHTETNPKNYVAPLIGRPYSYGILDCYTLLKDFYEQEFGIKLNDHERKGTLESDSESYLGLAESEGFRKVDMSTAKYGDVILMAIGGLTANHAAVYLGKNVMLHHLRGRLSSQDAYGGYWLQRTHGFYRHLDLM